MANKKTSTLKSTKNVDIVSKSLLIYLFKCAVCTILKRFSGCALEQSDVLQALILDIGLVVIALMSSLYPTVLIIAFIQYRAYICVFVFPMSPGNVQRVTRIADTQKNMVE